MSWRSRITEVTRDTLPSSWVPGEWSYVGPGEFQIRGTVGRSGDVLIPDADGRCQAPSLESARTDRNLLPDDDAMRSLRLIGQRLDQLSDEPWLMWTDVSPLVPPFEDTLDESPLEVHLKERLGALEAACRRPLAHLASEEERLLVSRCKRPAARAPVVLSARSEDWDRRTLWGVRPKRILGVVRDELLDIYENRLAVALVDHLSATLAGRMRSLRRAVRQLSEKRDYQEQVEGSATYRRAQRITRLWAEAEDDTEKLAQAEAALRRVGAFHRRVQALKDSRLYRAIGGAVSARTQLKMTNVLIHDDVYRRVAELWEAWEAHIRASKVDPEARWRQEQSAARGFDPFVLLVVVRALETLGFEPDERSAEKPLTVGAALTLDGPSGAITVEIHENEIAIQARHSRRPLRVVGVPAMLGASVTIGDWLSIIEPESPLLLAWMPCEEERADDLELQRLSSIGNRGEGGHLACVSIAPWEIESVENMARALRWLAWGGLYQAYPLGFDVEPSWREKLPATRQFTTHGLHREMRVPLEHHVPLWPELTAGIAELHGQEETLKARLSVLEGYVADHQDGINVYQEHGLAIGAVQAERQGVLQRLDDVRRSLTKLQAIWDHASRARRESDSLLVCPICAQGALPRDFHGDGRSFTVRCRGCRSSWGLRRCAASEGGDTEACDAPIPFLEFSGGNGRSSAPPSSRQRDSDILAIPLGRGVFICPTCGRPSDGGSSV